MWHQSRGNCQIIETDWAPLSPDWTIHTYLKDTVGWHPQVCREVYIASSSSHYVSAAKKHDWLSHFVIKSMPRSHIFVIEKVPGSTCWSSNYIPCRPSDVDICCIIQIKASLAVSLFIRTWVNVSGASTSKNKKNKKKTTQIHTPPTKRTSYVENG